MPARHLTISHATSRPGRDILGQTIVGTCLALYRRSLQRQALRHLPDQLLEDIGLTRAEAEAEADKPFWRR